MSEHAGHHALGLERLLTFSDGVFAIAITLLVLDVRLPPADHALGSGELLRALGAIAPKYFGYAASFVVVGLFWIGHHRKFRHVRRYDEVVLRLNLALLLVVGFVPFAAAVLSEHDNVTAVMFYDAVMLVVGGMSAGLGFYLTRREGLIDPALVRAEVPRIVFEPLRVALVFALSMIVAPLSLRAAQGVWALIPLAGSVLRLPHFRRT